jgi:hypothetical protein
MNNLNTPRRPSHYHFNLISLLNQYNKGKLTQEEGDQLIKDIVLQRNPADIFDFLDQMKISLDAIFQILQNSIIHYQITYNTESTSVQIEHEEVMKIKDVTSEFKISRPTLDKWRRNGLVYYQDKGSIFFYKKDILEYLKNSE